MDVLNEAVKQGIAPAIVVCVYLIISSFINAKKEKTQIKISSELIKSINDISSFLSNMTKNLIDKDKDKCKNAIEDVMFASGMRLISFVSSTIVNNHITENKDSILGNIKNIVNSEFYSIYNTLSLYKIDGEKVSSYLNKDWMNVIEKDIIDSIYNNNLTVDDKILNFINKINIKIQSFSTYIINNAIK